MSPVAPADPGGMDRGRTLHGAMDGLLALAEGPVAAAFRDATSGGYEPTVSRYRPFKPNAPAIWHERRPSRVAPVDLGWDRTELYLAVTLAVFHRDGQTEGEDLEKALDAAQTIYRVASHTRGALNWAHRVEITNLEPPTPTAINAVPLLTGGIVLRVELDAPRQ